MYIFKRSVKLCVCTITEYKVECACMNIHGEHKVDCMTTAREYHVEKREYQVECLYPNGVPCSVYTIESEMSRLCQGGATMRAY